MPVAAAKRDYDAVRTRLRPEGDRTARMQAVVDALWSELHDKGVSWVGFYLKFPDADELILGPRRDKPACSPIALFGACGRSLLSGKPLVVTDVANLRAGYIACDPRDRSEVVIPAYGGEGEAPWGVLDVDSHIASSFSREDVIGLTRVLEAAGLTTPQPRFLDFDQV